MKKVPLQPIDGRVTVRPFKQTVTLAKGDQREIPVEIGAGAQIEAALQFAEMRLRRADRICLRNDGDIPENGAVIFRLAEPFEQEMKKGRSRQLVGMERRLDIGTRRCA